MGKWLRQHKKIAVLLAILSVVFIGSPQVVSAYWSLFSQEPLFVYLARQNIPIPSFSPLWITGPIGAGLLIAILRSLSPRPMVLTERQRRNIMNRREQLLRRDVGELDLASQGMKRRVRVSELADSVDESLICVSNSTSQELSISELADRLNATVANISAVPKVPTVGYETIADCSHVGSQYQWPEFHEIARRLDGLNALISQYNAMPTIDRAKKILEESKQVIPPLVVTIRTRISSIQ